MIYGSESAPLTLEEFGNVQEGMNLLHSNFNGVLSCKATFEQGNRVWLWLQKPNDVPSSFTFSPSHYRPADETTAIALGRKPEPPKVYRVYKDGDKWCATFEDFVNLQESPAGFGDEPWEAISDLTKRTPAGRMDAEKEGWMVAPDSSQLIDLREFVHANEGPDSSVPYIAVIAARLMIDRLEAGEPK